MTVGWGAMMGSPASIEAINSRLRRYGLGRVLRELSRLNIALEHRSPRHEDGSLEDQQDFVLAGLVGPEHTAALRRHATERLKDPTPSPDRLVFIHERQVLTAMKMALLCIGADAPADERTDMEPLLEALLMINDIIDARFENLDTLTPDGREQFAGYEFALAQFHARTITVSERPRAFHQFVEIPSGILKQSDFDVAAELTRATGLAPFDVFVAIHSIQTLWLAMTEDELIAGEVAMDPDRFFSTLTALDPAERAKWIALVATDLADLQARVRAKYANDLRHFDFLEFEKSPVVMIDGRLWCLSVPLLSYLGTDGLYHRLCETRHFTSAQQQLFRTSHGKLVEAYAVAGLKRMFGARCIPEATLKALPSLRNRKVCEAVIDCGDSLLLVDVKASRVPLPARHADGPAALLQAWRPPIERAASQMESLATSVRQDLLAPLGISASRILRIYPVLIVTDHVALPQTRARIEQQIIAHHPLGTSVARGEVERLITLSLPELEHLESAIDAGHDVVSLLQGLNNMPPHAGMNMSRHLTTLEPPIGRTPSWHMGEYERISALVVARLRALGMPQSGAG
ncbi:MAG: hypothetical protein IT353_09260 [Gemmatimonadaceae bacterium]|nr:hypothetical protein [Gemmatimonadaceae bacterium]